MFSPCLKCFLIILTPIPIALWTVVGVGGGVVMGIGYGFVWPVMETFKAMSKEGASIYVKLISCFKVMLLPFLIFVLVFIMNSMLSSYYLNIGWHLEQCLGCMHCGS